MSKFKKGFTLVELLSVIVILAVVVLIATNAVVPMMSSARKQVFATEANVMMDQAKILYAQEGGSGRKCYTYQDIIDAKLIDKNDEAYMGSFLIESNGNDYTYKVWLSNGKNLIEDKSPDINPEDVIDSSNDASTKCGAN